VVHITSNAAEDRVYRRLQGRQNVQGFFLELMKELTEKGET
jgi:hypothetical protein